MISSRWQGKIQSRDCLTPNPRLPRSTLIMQANGLGQSFTPHTGAGVLDKCLMNSWMSTLLWITLPDWLPVTWQVFWTRETLDKFTVVGEKRGAVSTESLHQQVWVRCLPEKPGKRHKITIMLAGWQWAEQKQPGKDKQVSKTSLSLYCGSKMTLLLSSLLPPFYHLTFNITQLGSRGSGIRTQSISHWQIQPPVCTDFKFLKVQFTSLWAVLSSRSLPIISSVFLFQTWAVEQKDLYSFEDLSQFLYRHLRCAVIIRIYLRMHWGPPSSVSLHC